MLIAGVLGGPKYEFLNRERNELNRIADDCLLELSNLVSMLRRLIARCVKVEIDECDFSSRCRESQREDVLEQLRCS